MQVHVYFGFHPLVYSHKPKRTIPIGPSGVCVHAQHKSTCYTYVLPKNSKII